MMATLLRLSLNCDGIEPPAMEILLDVPSRHAFTLVELLVVIAIGRVLGAILLPACRRARGDRRRLAVTSSRSRSRRQLRNCPQALPTSFDWNTTPHHELVDSG
jgi:prepilin-type N-terminal cleavage/methylation domain-containing protein